MSETYRNKLFICLFKVLTDLIPTAHKIVKIISLVYKLYKTIT